MAKFLFLSGTEHNFRLVADADAEDVRRELRRAMERGTIAEIAFEMGDDPRHRSLLTINGAHLPWFTIVEMGDPEITDWDEE